MNLRPRSGILHNVSGLCVVALSRNLKLTTTLDGAITQNHCYVPFYSEIMIQIVKRKCCGSVFAACVEPDCYTDKDWLKNLKEYVNRGDKVEMIENGTLKFGGKCQCSEVAKTEQPNLFSGVS